MIRFSLNKSFRRDYQPKRADISNWLNKALIFNYKTCYIDISIVTTDISKSLNYQYRHKNSPTNVIALEYNNTREYFAMLTGELILCDEIIVAESITQQKPVMAHYAHMIVHGMLHLQGLDHLEVIQAEEMERLEIKILQQLGFCNPYIDRN